MVAGLVPALAALRFGQDAGRTSPPEHLRLTMIGYQFALSLALLTAMGLVAGAQRRLLRPQLSYDPENVIVTRIDVGRLGISNWRAQSFYDKLMPRVQGMPGVSNVAVSSVPPFGGAPRAAVSVGGGNSTSASVRAVSPSYFRLAGIRLLQGRLFALGEVQFPVESVVVSESLARTLVPDGNAVGQTFRIGQGTTAEIIGVVDDTSSLCAKSKQRPGNSSHAST
jgi:macrolide transport system ATP-binding/permease protein